MCQSQKCCCQLPDVKNFFFSRHNPRLVSDNRAQIRTLQQSFGLLEMHPVSDGCRYLAEMPHKLHFSVFMRRLQDKAFNVSYKEQDMILKAE
ncbi:hypothetical protein NPIL_75541 [Nephila pilipes]|uniref:Uncharacterized protein n=1 Tax=Nephila pilipes TaxID=299642 RepID=A0A8X6U7C2_NEPPI|nr:hypothetical protein NPIL_75541 [Nephila pilipes]